MYRTIRYDSYDTHTASYDLWVLMIRRYDTELFTYDTYRVSYNIDNYVESYLSRPVELHI